MMIHKVKYLLVALPLILTLLPAFSQYPAELDCNPPTAIDSLDINNARVRLINGGEAWWGRFSSHGYDHGYEVPKGSGQVVAYAGSIWIGGIDDRGQLKIAAQTYRQKGNDFFPGPLDKNGSTNKEICNQWDRLFKVNRSEVVQFLADYEQGNTSSIPRSILDWPAKGNPHLSLAGNREMARFVDVNQDGIYDPYNGDYPDFCGDQVVWWVFNDGGNKHTETNGEPLGFEFHAEAFAYNNGDPFFENNTYYRYKIINKSSFEYHDLYFGLWADVDLGYAFDDFVGCDTTVGVAIAYNGDAIDGPGAASYGENPPLFGTTFIRTPEDSMGNELGMTNFMMLIKDYSVRGNPSYPIHYYNYLQSIWLDGQPLTKDGWFGYNPSGLYPETKYAYSGEPGDSAGWSECSAGNTPSDRRFLMSAGPFNLKAGASTEVIIGALWDRSSNTYPCPSFQPMRLLADYSKVYINEYCCNTTTSAIKEQAVFGMQVYPNPASHILRIVSGHELLRINKVQLFDLKGRLVYSSDNQSDREIQINIIDFPRGTYVYRVQDQFNRFYSGKIVVGS